MKEKQFALALYENQAESEDELTFRKNDILTLFEMAIFIDYFTFNLNKVLLIIDF